MISNLLEYKGNRRLAWLLFIWLNGSVQIGWGSFYLYDLSLHNNEFDFYFLLIIMIFGSIFMFCISMFVSPLVGDSVVIQNKEVELHKWYGRKIYFRIKDVFEINAKFCYKVFIFSNVNSDTKIYTEHLELKIEDNNFIYIPIGDKKNIECEIERIKEVILGV